MKPESSLPHSQVTATCPYPEPARSNPYPHPHFLKIHCNIILPSMPVSSRWSQALRFPNQNPVYVCPLPHSCYMPRPSHSYRFYHPKNIGWGAYIEIFFKNVVLLHFNTWVSTICALYGTCNSEHFIAHVSDFKWGVPNILLVHQAWD